jgi:hypothetical protein
MASTAPCAPIHCAQGDDLVCVTIAVPSLRSGSVE